MGMSILILPETLINLDVNRRGEKKGRKKEKTDSAGKSDTSVEKKNHFRVENTVCDFLQCVFYSPVVVIQLPSRPFFFATETDDASLMNRRIERGSASSCDVLSIS